MRRGLLGSVAVALALVVAACGKGGAEDNSGGSASSGEAAVKIGPGATADTITLGYLPDLSGVFAPNGKSMMEGANLYWDAKNKAGGICGRQVKGTYAYTLKGTKLEFSSPRDACQRRSALLAVAWTKKK